MSKEKRFYGLSKWNRRVRITTSAKRIIANNGTGVWKWNLTVNDDAMQICVDFTPNSRGNNANSPSIFNCLRIFCTQSQRPWGLAHLSSLSEGLAVRFGNAARRHQTASLFVLHIFATNCREWCNLFISLLRSYPRLSLLFILLSPAFSCCCCCCCCCCSLAPTSGMN